ncbi:MAG: GNAT family N-acetyltransferase [Candidatus Bathyarchaeia archaeon]|nr:GNAT family N-acetyltransferase [Candidatus Bathyarchaeota archaeon A05DMB-4]MDH7595150.1 GNAT family N-acetyltransferase [Candidatus Bathyarchaeota archaeon]
MYVKVGGMAGVCTGSDYRRKGLMTNLMQQSLEYIKSKGAAVVYAAHIRNPYYPRIFSKLGFFDVETDGVFMYTVVDPAKFLKTSYPSSLTDLND